MGLFCPECEDKLKKGERPPANCEGCGTTAWERQKAEAIRDGKREREVAADH